MIEIKSDSSFEDLLKSSEQEKVLLLKHSTQCPISAAAYDEVEQFCKKHPEVKTYLVLVIENRAQSNLIETKSGIRHESPQVLVFENLKCVWNTSHRAITVAGLEEQFLS